jgi:hypothetical protein
MKPPKDFSHHNILMRNTLCGRVSCLIVEQFVDMFSDPLTHYAKLKLKHSSNGKRSMEVPTSRRHSVQTIPGTTSDCRKAVNYIQLRCLPLWTLPTSEARRSSSSIHRTITPSHSYTSICLASVAGRQQRRRTSDVRAKFGTKEACHRTSLIL